MPPKRKAEKPRAKKGTNNDEKTKKMIKIYDLDIYQQKLMYKTTSGLTTRQIFDIQSTLEHLLTVGSKVRRDNWRRQKFQDRHELQLKEEHSLPLDAPPCASKPGGPPDNPDLEVFAEDIRIYGDIRKRNCPKPPWPSNQKKPGPWNKWKNRSDNQWDIEHGDTVHPLSFSKARLSQIPPTEEEREWMDGKNLSIGSTDLYLSESEVPRALLLKCWQRAVHAASCRIYSPVKTKEPSSETDIDDLGTDLRGASAAEPGNAPTADNSQVHNLAAMKSTAKEASRLRNETTANSSSTLAERLSMADSDQEETAAAGDGCRNTAGPHEAVENKTSSSDRNKPDDTSTYLSYQQVVGRDTWKTRAKCAHLGIDLQKYRPKNNDCPRCTRCFSSLDELEDHYYGGPNERGCCWRTIEEKHRSMIQTVLHRHVESQTDLLIAAVMEKAKEKVPDTPSSKRPRLLNWHDLMRFIEKMLVDSQTVESGQHSPQTNGHPVLETLQTKPGASAVVLNPSIMDSATRRLIDRYAEVPR